MRPPAPVDSTGSFDGLAGRAALLVGMTTTVHHPLPAVSYRSDTADTADTPVSIIDGLERALFDGQGHIHRHVGADQATEMLVAINRERHRLGWLALDMRHCYCWPTELSA